MASRMQLGGRTTLITGAGSGIGRAVAINLAKRGCNLALVDIDPGGLAETAALVGCEVRVSQHRVDIADPDQIEALPAQTRSAHAGVDIVINNAGVALGGRFEQVSADDFEWLFAINFMGVVRMTRAFLPLLRESDDARLVNLSSIFGLIAPPGQTAYVASKFAVRGFSESLRHELKGSAVGVTVVHPGGVATAIARRARAPHGASNAQVERQVKAIEAKLTLSPAVAAAKIVRGVERRRPRVLVGLDAHLAATLERIAPVSYMSILGRRLG